VLAVGVPKGAPRPALLFRDRKIDTRRLQAMRLLKTSLANDPALSYNNVSVVNTSLRNYYGNSNGGIMGSVYMGLTTDVTEGCIGVGGGPYSLMVISMNSTPRHQRRSRARQRPRWQGGARRGAGE